MLAGDGIVFASDTGHFPDRLDRDRVCIPSVRPVSVLHVDDLSRLPNG